MSIGRLLLVLLCFLLAKEAAAETFDSISAIRALPPERAREGLPVRLDATITYFDSGGWRMCFVSDGQTGISLKLTPPPVPARPLPPGTRVRIEGRTDPGEFLPRIDVSKLEVLGDGPVPPPRTVTPEQLLLPALDCEWVECSGVVKGTTVRSRGLVLDIEVGGRLLKVRLPEGKTYPTPPWHLIERHVRVRGVAATLFNDQRQMLARFLYVQSLADLVTTDPPPASLNAPLLNVDEILRVDAPFRQSARVQGIVTHIAPGEGVYLRGTGGSLFAQTAQPLDAARGDTLEVEGYAMPAPFRPTLNTTGIRVLRNGPPPDPLPFDPTLTRNSREHHELITLQAEFLELARRTESTALMCRANGRLFEAILPGTGAPATRLEPGSTLRLTGLCEIVTESPLDLARAGTTSFRLRLRDPQDVAVVANPPWWNPTRALWVVGAIGGLAIVAGAWALTLRRIVARQTVRIREQARQQATLDERQRIARDLHDTLEQELVGVSMLLDNAAGKLQGAPPQCTEPLGIARRLLRRAREDSRSTIRDLRDATLEGRELPDAMEELLRPLAAASGCEFRVETAGTPTDLAGTFETHLLRIAQEAVSNTTRHARATEIVIRVRYGDDSIHVMIRDNGCGFDPAAMADAAASGHFGLSGMRERAEKIGGSLHVLSQPGAGTTIEVRAPIRRGSAVSRA